MPPPLSSTSGCRCVFRWTFRRAVARRRQFRRNFGRLFLPHPNSVWRDFCSVGFVLTRSLKLSLWVLEKNPKITYSRTTKNVSGRFLTYSLLKRLNHRFCFKLQQSYPNKSYVVLTKLTNGSLIDLRLLTYLYMNNEFFI